MGVISRVLDSVDNAVQSTGEATAAVTESKLDAILKGVVAVIGAILLLIFFALNPRLTLALIALLIGGAYLLDIDIGGRDRNSSGPRR